jgi:hypothetical protein
VFVKSRSNSLVVPVALPLRCPACGRDGTFAPIVGLNDHAAENNQYVGHRRCPNPACQTHIFVVWKAPHDLIASYPAQMIDFDKTDIPPSVVSCFEEALRCHSQECYRAAAMMVRKTLEVLCADRKAEGETLKDRIQALKARVVLPDTLFGALDALRLLGNDAAHIDARTYSDIGEAEVKAGVAVTKEILKAVYQYESLVRQLAALRKPAGGSA